MTAQEIIAQAHAIAALSSEERQDHYARIRREHARQYNQSRAEQTDDYDCPQCLNRTWFMNDDESLRPCACQSIRKGLSSLKKLGLLGAAQRLTFDRFRTDAPWQQAFLSRARAYAESDAPRWLFIGGQSGCGKTHLCMAASVRLLHRGMRLRYMRWMNDSMKIKSLSMEPDRERLMQEFISAPLLYIDDLFKAAPTAADLHLAFELLDARYCDAAKRTIISSERTIDDLFALDEAIAGRILERCGDDFLLTIPRDASRNMRLSGA